MRTGQREKAGLLLVRLLQRVSSDKLCRWGGYGRKSRMIRGSGASDCLYPDHGIIKGYRMKAGEHRSFPAFCYVMRATISEARQGRCLAPRRGVYHILNKGIKRNESSNFCGIYWRVWDLQHIHRTIIVGTEISDGDRGIFRIDHKFVTKMSKCDSGCWR